MNEIKRKYYNGREYTLDRENKVLRLSPEFHQILKDKKLWGGRGFKKVGGSSIGDVLLVDQYKSRFLAFARIASLAVPILDRKYVDAGIAIEPKVINAIEEATGKKVEGFDPYQYNFDYFADKDDVVGGLPDGFIEQDGLVLEIKTTGEKNLEKWNKWGVPAGYHKQAQLYTYLMGQDRYSIVATFLKEEDYANPSEYPIKSRILKNWNFTLDKAKAEDDIKEVKDWYARVTQTGVSDQYSEKVDAELLEWLECRNEDEWEMLKERWIAEGKIK